MSSSLHKSVGAETTSTVPSTPRLPLLTPTRTLSVAAAFTTPDVSQSKTTARTPETELHQLLDEKFPKSLSLNATPTTRVDVPTSSSSSTHLREQEQHHTVTVPPPPTPLTLQLQLESTSTGLANLRELSLCRNSQMSALGVQHILRRAKKLRSIKLSQCNLRLTENILCLIFGQKKLPYLQIVDLSFLQGPIENFEYLQPGNVLRELNLGRTNLTNAGVQRIRKLCVHLEKLFLPWCREISDGAFVDVEEPAVLENSSSAAASVVNSNGVVNEQHTSAGAEVQVSSNNKDSIPNKVVSELPRLRMLDLCGTQIGDLTLQKFVFSKLIRLQELDISWCGMVKLNGIHFSDAVFAKRRVGSSSTSGVSSRSRALALANKKQDATSKMANNAVGQEDATNVEAVAQRPEMGCDVTSVPMPAHTSSEVSAAKKEVEVADLPLPPFDLVGDINNNNESGKESVFPDKSSAPVEHIGVDVDLPPLDLVGEISNESSKESVFPAQPTDSTDQDGRESVYTTLSSQLSQGDPTELEYNNFHCCSTPFSMSSSCYNNDVGKATSSSTMRGPDHSPGGSTTSRSINSATVFNLTADNRARRGSIDFIKDRAANLAPATQRARSRGSSREQTPPVAHSGRGAASGTTSSCSPSSRKGERGGAASVQRADRVVTFQSEGRDVVVSSERRTAQASAPISANSTAINAIGGGSGSTKTLVRQDSSITPRLAVPTNNGANSSSTTSNSAAPKRGLTALHLTGLWNLERVIAADPARTLGLSRSLQTLRLDNIEIGPSVLHALAANCPSLQNLGLQIRPFLCEMIAEEQIVSSCSSSTAAAENPPSSAAENPFLVLSQTCQQLEVLAVDCEQPSIVVDALATGFPRLKALRLRCPLFDNDLSRILAAKTVHLEQLDLADVNLADDTLRRWMEDAEDEEEEDSGSAGGSGRAVYRRSMDISEQDLLKHDDEDSSADAGLDEEDEDDHHADCPSEPAQNERRLHEQVRGTLANLLTFHARAHQLTDTGANCLANMLVSALTVELDSPFLSKGALSHFLRQEQLQFLRRVQITAGAEGGGTGGGASKKHVWSGDKKRDSEKRLRERNMLAVLQEGGSEMEMSD
ncbi:unnamed protein product [Amoebophrya sp. A25]|nr:unnamed protein product [Amoebophrya sp. A25]|eukprot:GSA25T00007019001.1